VAPVRFAWRPNGTLADRSVAAGSVHDKGMTKVTAPLGLPGRGHPVGWPYPKEIA
jgi:hypothetical protein